VTWQLKKCEKSRLKMCFYYKKVTVCILKTIIRIIKLSPSNMEKPVLGSN